MDGNAENHLNLSFLDYASPDTQYNARTVPSGFRLKSVPDVFIKKSRIMHIPLLSHRVLIKLMLH